MYALDLHSGGLQGPTWPSYALTGFGQMPADAEVPYRPHAVYLRLTDTLPEVLNYAAGGFHVSVSRGVVGGCGDPAIGYAKGGTVSATCSKPLGQANIRTAWEAAAQAYRRAYQAAQPDPSGATGTIEGLKAGLREANLLADAAYALERIPPPRDPGPTERPPVSTDPVEPIGDGSKDGKSKRSLGAKFAWAGVALLGAGAIIGAAVWAGSGKDEDKVKKSSKTARYSARR